MTHGDSDSLSELEASPRLMTVIAELSAKFINLWPAEIDREIRPHSALGYRPPAPAAIHPGSAR